MIALYWLALALVALAIEAVSRQFVLLFVGVGAFLAAVVTELGAPFDWQFATFGVASIALPFLLRRPLMARFHGRGVPSRTDELIGQTAVVTETIDPVLATGRVVVAGQDWMARCDTRLEARRLALIVGADGIALLVEPLPVDLYPST